MARIRSYDLVEQTQIDNNDYLLGNDTDSAGAIATKRFGMDTLREFFGANTARDIAAAIPRGFMLAVGQQGSPLDPDVDPLRSDGIERAPLFISHESVTANALDLVQGTTLENANYSLGSSGTTGQATISFVNFDLPYYLPSFVGTTIEFNITGAAGVSTGPYRATITSYNPAFTTNANPIPAEFTDSFGIQVVEGGTALPVINNSDITSLNITGSIRSLKLNITGDLDIDGTLTLDGPLVVNGTSQFNNTVTIGTDGPDGTGEADLIMHGDIRFDDNQGGVVFGESPNSVSVTTDGSNITFGGSGNINIDNTSGNFNIDNDITVQGSHDIILQGGTIHARQNDGSDFTPPLQIQPVVGNNTTGRPAGTLTDIRIGDEYFHLPTAQSQTAFVLPGLSEGLSPVPGDTDITTTTFFYAVDQGTSAEYTPPAQGQPSNTFTVPSQTVEHGQTTFTVSPLTMSVTETFTGTGAQTVFTIQGDVVNDGNDIVVIQGGTTLIRGVDWQYDAATEHITFTSAPPIPGDGQPNISVTYTGQSTTDATLISAFEGIPTGQRLFFIPSTSTLPASAGMVQGDVYEVVSYLNGEVTFSVLGRGNLIISAPSVTLNNVPVASSTSPANFSNDFVIRQQDNTLSVATLTDIAGAQAQATYTDSAGNAVNVRSVEFISADNSVTIPTPGNISIDITGRFPLYMNGDEQTGSFTANKFETHLLGMVATDAVENARTVTLPNGVTNDALKIVNLSTLGDNGVDRSSGVWRIIPETGQRIMKLPADQNLVLNDPTASFELTYVNDTTGWIINGLN